MIKLTLLGIFLAIGLVLGEGEKPECQDSGKVEPWIEEIKRIRDIIDRLKDDFGRLDQDGGIVKPWLKNDPMHKKRGGEEQDGGEIVEPWTEEIKRIRGVIDRIKDDFGRLDKDGGIVKPWLKNDPMHKKRGQASGDDISVHNTPEQDDGQIVEPWTQEIDRIRDIIGRIKDDFGRLEKDGGIIKPWLKDDPMHKKRNGGQDGDGNSDDQISVPENIKPWLGELQKIQDHLRERRNGNGGDGDVVNVKPWLDKLQHIQEQIRKNHGGGQEGETVNVKPWLDKLQHIQDQLRKNHGDQNGDVVNVKPWLDKLQHIYDQLRKNRGGGQEGDTVNVKPWLDKLQHIMDQLRKNHDGNGGDDTVNVKPWLTDLQKILAHLRQNGKTDDEEVGNPRHHLIGRRPPTPPPSRARRAGGFGRPTKHPMPFDHGDWDFDGLFN